MAAAESAKRIACLDGLRGVAITLVVLFHAYARWPGYVPWETTHREFPLFRFGYLGVELFFLISGFVIYLSIEKCQSFAEFIVKRWVRLFPAMLIATTIVFCAKFVLPQRPGGPIALINALPGLLFLDPLILSGLFGIKLPPVEGVFWTLFVEVKFYFVFGILYFINKAIAVNGLIVLFLMGCLYSALIPFFPAVQNQVADFLIADLFSLKYFGWFSLGALVYKYHSTGKLNYLLTSFALLPVAIIGSLGNFFEIFLLCVSLYTVFVLAIVVRPIGRIFSTRLPVFTGFISYPLYLIHENAIISLAMITRSKAEWLPGMLVPIPGLALIVGVAFLIARHGEPLLQSLLRKKLSPLTVPSSLGEYDR